MIFKIYFLFFVVILGLFIGESLDTDPELTLK